MPHISTPIQYNNTASVTNVTATFANSIPVGHTLIAVVTTNGLSAQDGPFTATDTKGNTWVERSHHFKSGTLQTSVLSCAVTTALSSSDTLTVAHGTIAVNLWALSVEDFDDLAAFDVQVNAEGGSTTPDSGPTATGAQANELVFGGFGLGSATGQTFTPASGWANSPIVTSSGTTTRSAVAAWSYTTTTAAREAKATLGVSTSWAAAAVVFKSNPPAQVAKPATDITTTGWTKLPSTESTYSAGLADNDPTTGVESPASPVNAVLEVKVDPLSTPLDNNGHKIRFEAILPAGASSGTATVALVQGTTVKATSPSYTLSTTSTLYEFDLTSTQAASITDYTDLRLRFTVSAS